MSRVDFHRAELKIGILRGGAGEVVVRASAGTVTVETRFPAMLVKLWLEQAQTGAPFMPELQLGPAVAAWSGPRRLPATEWAQRVLHRVAIEIADPALAALDWEQALDPLTRLPPTYQRALVRTCAVRGWAESRRFTLPLRLLQVDAAPGRDLPAMLRTIFGKQTEVEEAFVASQARLAELGPPGLTTRQSWPTTEILHFDHLPTLHSPELLSTAQVERPGTLGWLARLTGACQTRLVTIDAQTRAEAAAAWRLAAALVGQGGPAVLVAAAPLPPDRSQFYRDFYDKLIHDFPLDAALGELAAGGQPVQGATLFCGAGREDAMRVSSVGLALARLAETLTSEPKSAEAVDVRRMVIRRIAAQLEGEPSTRALAPPTAAKYHLRQFEKGLKRFQSDWHGYHFEFHEREGLLPLSKQLRTIRGAGKLSGPMQHRAGTEGRLSPLRGSGPEIPVILKPGGVMVLDTGSAAATRGGAPGAAKRGAVQEGAPPPGAAPPAPAPAAAPQAPTAGAAPPAPAPAEPDLETSARFVNSSLWREDSAGDLQRIAQSRARLRNGETVHLRIQIGPRDAEVRVVDAVGLFEEQLKWTPDMEGVWLDAAVVGLDFDVVGEPVQPLWLPRLGPSEPLHFAVIPRRSGIALLRFCLYRGNNLVQSFRLAAVVQDRAGSRRTRPAAALARALDLPATQVSDEGYLARLEYSTVASAEDMADRPDRALTLLANTIDDRSVVTVKGDDVYGTVELPANLADLVGPVRGALHEIARPAVKDLAPELWLYAFGEGDRRNFGTPAKLRSALIQLADVGWQLYAILVPADSRQQLEEALGRKEQGVIHVAHMLLEHVLPWAVIYDRPFDKERRKGPGGAPVTTDACLAALPDPPAPGTPPNTASALRAHVCGEHEECLLNPARLTERAARGEPAVIPETVACPLHFWGFKHILEVPVQQVEKGEEGAEPPAQATAADKTVLVAAGINPALKLLEEHKTELLKIFGSRAKWAFTETDRDVILDGLKQQSALDIVYFFCHARGGAADPTIKAPYLEFDAAGRIRSTDLAGQKNWQHRPLVILNGCGTAAFSPDALSPFVKILVRDRGAGGVIGTEIPVFEQLATEMGDRIVHEYLAGAPVGRALLAARRSLLAQYNPLGLAYTLYGVAELALKAKPAGVAAVSTSA